MRDIVVVLVKCFVLVWTHKDSIAEGVIKSFEPLGVLDQTARLGLHSTGNMAVWAITFRIWPCGLLRFE